MIFRGCNNLCFSSKSIQQQQAVKTCPLQKGFLFLVTILLKYFDKWLFSKICPTQLTAVQTWQRVQINHETQGTLGLILYSANEYPATPELPITGFLSRGEGGRGALNLLAPWRDSPRKKAPLFKIPLETCSFDNILIIFLLYWNYIVETTYFCPMNS